jgi:hypothetical protein
VFIVWLIVLLVHGLAFGWHEIGALAWWLLAPFVVQDIYDQWQLMQKRK